MPMNPLGDCCSLTVPATSVPQPLEELSHKCITDSISTMRLVVAKYSDPGERVKLCVVVRLVFPLLAQILLLP
jgi:hypothetical protein